MRTFARPLRILLVAACPALLVPACVDDDTPAPVVPGVDASLPETGSPDGGGIDAGLPDTSAVVTDAAIDSADSDAALDGSADATDATDAADAGVVPQPNDIFVNATSGSDSNTGAQGQPFKTLTKAMSVATSGKNVWLEDGTWNGAVDAPLSAANAAPPCSGTGVNVPAGVNLRAINPGAATIAFDGSSGICTDGGVLAGFKVKRTGGSGGAGLVIRSGTTAMAGVSLEGNGQYGYALMRVLGSAKVAMAPGNLTNYAINLGAAIRVESATGELVVNGGAFNDAKQAGFARGAHIQSAGKLVLNGVTLERPVANQNGADLIGIFASTGSVVELRGASVVKGFVNDAGLFLEYGANVLLTDTALVRDNQSGLVASGFGTLSPTSLTLSGSATVRNNSLNGIRGDFVNGHDLQLTIEGAASITENAYSGIEYSKGTFTMTGGSVTKNGTSGISIYTALTSFSMRNATVTENAGYGVLLQAFSGTADLGTKANPGNNVINSNATTVGTVNLRVERDGVTAIGNTWDPNVQGTDAMGKVPTPDAGVTEITGPANGKNFWVTVAGHKLRVAEQ